MKDLAGTSVGRLTMIMLATAALMSPAIAAAQTLTLKGPLTNGENHAGAIAPLETHAWTLTATQGDAIVISVGEVGADSSFTPYIGVYTDTYVASNFGSLSAHVNVNAPVTGTYTVYVNSSTDLQNAGAGSYWLTVLKAPGAFIVPPGDEGGPMVNGAHHPGYIHRADQDPWSFVATAGDSISVSIGEVGDTNFAPWIRLFAPNGAYLGEGYSQPGGKIDVTVPLSGTYTVVVASADATYAAAGSYLLTLAQAPGPFVVPSDDEGGPMTAGVGYRGFINRADLDQWAFSATSGNVLSIFAAEPAGVDSGFYPWIRLYAPNGTYLQQSYGATAAQINVTAPSTGLYKVVVASADLTFTASGSYSLIATGIDPPPPVALGDTVVDFGDLRAVDACQSRRPQSSVAATPW